VKCWDDLKQLKQKINQLTLLMYYQMVKGKIWERIATLTQNLHHKIGHPHKQAVTDTAIHY
jgi:hypothetical protein